MAFASSPATATALLECSVSSTAQSIFLVILLFYFTRLLPVQAFEADRHSDRGNEPMPDPLISLPCVRRAIGIGFQPDREQLLVLRAISLRSGGMI